MIIMDTTDIRSAVKMNIIASSTHKENTLWKLEQRML